MLNELTRSLRRTIAGEVSALFHDAASGERPMERSSDGLFGPRSVARRVNGDVVGMMTGGIAALLLEMLHPAVLAGVWDHSGFRTDMHGRLRRTARFVAITTFGSRGGAEAAVARVRAIHDRISGTLPCGTPYTASDPASLAWVHVTGAASFLAGWRRYAEPHMSGADQDRYFAEMAEVARALGADPVPRDRRAAHALVEAMRPALRADERSEAVKRHVLDQRASRPMTAPFLALTLDAGVDLLPGWALRMHGLAGRSTIPRPLLRAGTFGMARTLRWAFA